MTSEPGLKADTDPIPFSGSDSDLQHGRGSSARLLVEEIDVEHAQIIVYPPVLLTFPGLSHIPEPASGTPASPMDSSRASTPDTDSQPHSRYSYVPATLVSDFATTHAPVKKAATHMKEGVPQYVPTQHLPTPISFDSYYMFREDTPSLQAFRGLKPSPSLVEGGERSSTIPGMQG